MKTINDGKGKKIIRSKESFSFILFERKKTQELNLQINNQLLQSFLLSKINEKRWRS